MGATVANPAQLRVVRTWGVERVFLANELMDPREIAWLRRELEASVAPGGTPFEVWVYVDSIEGVGLLTRGFAGASPEVVAGSACSSRSESPAVGQVSAARPTPWAWPAPCAAGLRLPGSPGTRVGRGRHHARGPCQGHGLLPRPARRCGGFRPRGPGARRRARGRDRGWQLVPRRRARRAPRAAHGRGHGRTGGCGRPDAGEATRDVRVVVRSGAYVTHDHGFCARMDPWDRIPGGEPMHAAAVVGPGALGP
ncbi:hypothetical protein NKG05_20390 [Oerskovia sp. M15]